MDERDWVLLYEEVGSEPVAYRKDDVVRCLRRQNETRAPVVHAATTLCRLQGRPAAA